MASRQLSFDGRTLQVALDEAQQIIDEAVELHHPKAVFALCSGGNDSTVLLDVVRDRIDAVIHVNTGIGIPETNQFVRDLCSDWGLTLHELHPPEPYESHLERIGGFPGPMQHRYIYQRIKERALRVLQRELLVKRDDRILYLSGIRSQESRKRMSYDVPIHKEGRVIWANPLLFWRDDDMREYRECHPDLPVNEVTRHLHMSGECLCGAFAKPGELEEIEFFYPEVAARIHAIEKDLKAKGMRGCQWGQKPKPKTGDVFVPAGPMCSSCTLGQLSLDEALEVLGDVEREERHVA